MTIIHSFIESFVYSFSALTEDKFVLNNVELMLSCVGSWVGAKKNSEVFPHFKSQVLICT